MLIRFNNILEWPTMKRNDELAIHLTQTYCAHVDWLGIESESETNDTFVDLHHDPPYMQRRRAMTSWSIFINGCVQRCFSYSSPSLSLSLLFPSLPIDNHTYRHIYATVDEQYLTHARPHTSVSVRSFVFDFSLFFPKTYSFPLSSTHAQRKKDMEAIIEG